MYKGNQNHMGSKCYRICTWKESRLLCPSALGTGKAVQWKWSPMSAKEKRSLYSSRSTRKTGTKRYHVFLTFYNNCCNSCRYLAILHGVTSVVLFGNEFKVCCDKERSSHFDESISGSSLVLQSPSEITQKKRRDVTAKCSYLSGNEESLYRNHSQRGH